VDYEIVPGVPAFAAAAAALGRELTVPGVAQTVTLTRVATLSTAMPDGRTCRRCRRPARRWCYTSPLLRSTRSSPRFSPADTARNALCGGGIRELAADRSSCGAHSPSSPRNDTPQRHQDRGDRRRRRAAAEGFATATSTLADRSRRERH
jgi:hypothetical protein